MFLCVCTQEELGGAAVTHVALWGAMVAQCCGEERPAEVKLTAAKVLVEATPTLLTSAMLPLGKYLIFTIFIYRHAYVHPLMVRFNFFMCVTFLRDHTHCGLVAESLHITAR